MNRRVLLVGAVAFLLMVGLYLYAAMQSGSGRKLVRQEDKILKDLGMVTEPMTSSIRNFSPVLPIRTKARAEKAAPVLVRPPVAQITPQPKPPNVSLTIFASGESAPTPASHGPKGDFAPSFRLVKCQLVNTVDSSNLNTPIIGLVTDDLWWNGKVIIRANSEVHGVASVDTVRERIASKGDFTFVLSEPAGLGRELVVRGMALDMERDDKYNTYGITDGSAGLRGDVIRTANGDLIKLYAASLINGISGAFSSSSNGLLGNRVYTNSNSIGLSALQNGVINPAAGGTQAVLERYADQIAQSIERNGFFVRVPAGKQFYVYCTEAIDLSKAQLGADSERLAREKSESQLDKFEEQVRKALPVGASQMLNPLLPALGALNSNK